ncbi:MAG: methionine--tRNA ligase, partial [Gammaproteobacteria bacterium]|nr:methionine--tRNA ligase [Gammaproteobacteria bacterium]
MRRILVTSALPNANGAMHLGHLFEHIQTDIWVRFQRMVGNECYYVCADDAHGTATMLAAERAGTTAEAMIESFRQEHAEDFRRFLVEHDNYYSTHSPENEQLTAAIYERLAADGRTFTAEVEQLYDPERELFLADRFVQGTCPRCGEEDQYGDNCQECGATYDATELGNPRSLLSDATPELRSSAHYFFDVAQFSDFLKEWTASDAVQPEVANKLAEWLTGGLKAWDISRDGPYFGFIIPGAEDKYFYVWMDAPVGYMASFKNLCDRTEGLEFDDFWRLDCEGEVHHFIGKDIINFHCLFWPA